MSLHGHGLVGPADLTLLLDQHCIVAVRKSTTDPSAEPWLPSWFNRGLDTQVILAEVRETSRKPDELYDMVERILGGSANGRKVELFGRSHNCRDGWYAVDLSNLYMYTYLTAQVRHARFTIGNQFETASQVFENDVVKRYNERYV